MIDHQKTILIDWDGVIHSYTSPWVEATYIPDDPVDGAIEWLADLIEAPDFQPIIFSTRCEFQEAIAAMKAWLLEHGLTQAQINKLAFTHNKLPAWIIIDDRAWKFEGIFPDLSYISTFRTWNK